MKIYFAGERDMKANDFMKWIKNRLISYYYHNRKGQPSRDLADWIKHKTLINDKK